MFLYLDSRAVMKLKLTNYTDHICDRLLEAALANSTFIWRTMVYYILYSLLCCSRIFRSNYVKKKVALRKSSS